MTELDPRSMTHQPSVPEEVVEYTWRERLLEVLRKVESEPELIGASAHVLEVARR